MMLKPKVGSDTLTCRQTLYRIWSCVFTPGSPKRSIIPKKYEVKNVESFLIVKMSGCADR